MPTEIITIKASKSRHNTWLKNRKAPDRPSRSKTSEKTGTIAEVSAPSPSKRRNKLGRVKARMKAEFHKLVPKAAKIKTSRNKPKSREPTVDRLTTAMFFIF